MQLVAPWQAETLPVTDLAAFAPSSRSHEASRLAVAEADRPFDLAAGPLFRASLVRVEQNDHLLLLTLHHAVCDGWSVGVFYDELKALYAALVDGHASPLGELAIQYGDFAAWQRGRAVNAKSDREIDRLAQRLGNLPPECTFPADRPRPGVQSYRGAVHRSVIDRTLLDHVTSLARAQEVTPFIVLLAAFKTLLFRHNAQDIAVVGVPIASRVQTQLESLIGFFANSLALPTELSGDPSFSELLGRVRATVMDGFAHQEVPLERIVEQLKLPRNPGRTPLFQVMFAFQNLPERSGGEPPISVADNGLEGRAFDLAPGLSARPLPVGRTTAKFDLTLYLDETPAGMAACWQYSSDLFEPATIARIADQFDRLIGSIIADPSKRLSELQLISDEERRRIETAWTGTDAKGTAADDFILQLEAQAARTPGAIAVCDDAGGFTYAELNDRANRYARYFQTRGIAGHSLVGVCLPRSADFAAIFAGLWKAGAAFLPLDPEYPAERIRFMLEDGDATHIIADDATPALTEAMPLPVLNIARCGRQIERQDPRNLDIETAPGAAAYVIYTSGSTGRPKGVTISRGNVGHYARALAAAIGIGPGDRYLHTASFAVSSSIRQFVVPLSVGATIQIASREALRDPRLLFAAIRSQRISVLDLVPSFSASCLRVMQSIDAAARSELLDNDVRLMLSASEPLASRLIADWRALWRSDLAVTNMYGQTETTGIVLTHEVPPAGDPAIITPIGRPIANTRAYVLDTALSVVPAGIRGELYIGGSGVGSGYRNRPEQTAQAFLADPFATGTGQTLYRTGDLARYRTDGTIEIHGRVDAQIKFRGFRIEPGEIEAVICDQPEVRECVVCAVSGVDDRDQDRLVAFIILRKASSGSEAVPAGLLHALKHILPDHMIPQRVVVMDHLPLTISGKIDRQALLAALPPISPHTSAFVAAEPRLPRAAKTRSTTEVEAILTAVWQTVLRRDEIGVDDNFFDLGGNSLLTINMMLEAMDAGLDLDLKQLYQHQTIADLARALTGAAPEIAQPVTAAAAARGETDDGILVTIDSLRAFGCEALIEAGLRSDGAAIVTEVQLEASMRGQPTHDMVSIPRYATRIRSGKINPSPDMRIEHETANIARIDGDNGPGQWVATVAMDVAIRKARESGCGIVSVRRSNHFGAAAQYVWQATNKGLIGLCTTNGPLILAPTGGVTAMFGNNPLGVGIPAGQRAPILLDIAMSVAPRGKIGLAVAEGQGLTPGWILDKAGRPSIALSDLAAGLGVPIGGHKGYGLAMVMEVLAGVLSGAGFGSDHHRDRLDGFTGAPDFGHFFMALDPLRFMPAAEFATRVDQLIAQVKAGERAQGVDEILIPGEMELRTRARSLKQGVRLRRSTYEALLSHARKAGLQTRIELAGDDSVAASEYAK